MSTTRTIRRHCLTCAGGPGAVRCCAHQDCALYLLRVGRTYRGKAKPEGYLPPLRAVRAFCLACCLGQPLEVRACPATGCALHAYRFGRNPMVSKAKRAAAARMAFWRQKLAVHEGFSGQCDVGVGR
jgi:hypothetical protein